MDKFFHLVTNPKNPNKKDVYSAFSSLALDFSFNSFSLDLPPIRVLITILIILVNQYTLSTSSGTHDPTHISLYRNSIDAHSAVFISSKKILQFGTICSMRTRVKTKIKQIPLYMYSLDFFLFKVKRNHRLLRNGVDPSLINRHRAMYGNTPAVLK
ncbi:hypothetical protein BpHYR1_002600 [Brachionus plicatilis]|uniref:Uncharacterized protein n=1 Tax=Brachionus plicatilis TaxID=10195 RepID=A0A3M7PSL0_BRAPC|nr:hypothetical protein BpHYR1_002600 [Brachionus plicatilis]